MTPSGKPPKDLANVLHRKNEFPRSISISLSSLAAFLITFQIVVISKWIFKEISFKPTSTLYFEHTLNSIIAIGCILLNTSVILHLLLPLPIFCHWKPVVQIIAMALVNSSICIRVFTLSQFLNNFNGICSHQVHLKTRKRRSMAAYMRSAEHITKFRLISVIAFATASIVTLLIWLIIVDPLGIIRMTSQIKFDTIADEYYDISTEKCTSRYESCWLLAGFVLKRLVICVGACFLAYESRRTL